MVVDSQTRLNVSNGSNIQNNNQRCHGETVSSAVTQAYTRIVTLGNRLRRRRSAGLGGAWFRDGPNRRGQR